VPAGGPAALGRWYSTNLLSVAIPLFGALAVIRFAAYLLRLAFSHGGWLDTFERSIATLVWIALAMHLTGILPEIVGWLSGVEFAIGKHELSLRTLLGAAVLVGYRTDMAEALRILVDVARVHPRVLKAPEPTAQVLSLADSGVDLELGFWIEDPERGSQNMRSDVSLALLAEFRACGIEIPYPQREVRLRTVPDEK